MNIPLVVLIVLDGWGLAPPGPGNAVSSASTPNMDKFWASFPHTQLLASGEAVGLPRAEVGNTETGHLNLGAGRIVYQDLPRINMAIADGSFFKNPAFLGTIEHARKNNSNLHLMGLLGAGGVHSSMEHVFALLRLCKEQNFERVFLHAFTDGRDSPPNAAFSYVNRLEEVIKNEGVGKVASVMGRYWAMDRDFRWERTEKAYRALTRGVGKHVTSAKKAIDESYEQGITDEFINPAIIIQNGSPTALVGEGDSVIFFNFRIDRPRQLTKAFVLEDFEKEGMADSDFDPYLVKYHGTHLVQVPPAPAFVRGQKLKDLFFVTMTEYGKPLNRYVSVAFPPVKIQMPLARVLSGSELRQLHMAESEKERFVTFYFNGQQELPFPGEVRMIVPSPKVPTYDQKPEMSAREVTSSFMRLVSDVSLGRYSFVVINFANPDMVGHTGNIEAAKKACEVIDECLGKIVQKVDSLGGATVVTADHGNAEQMLCPDGSPNTEHSANPVPFIVVGKEFLGRPETLQSGILADVAPTVLKLLGLPQPSEMTGRALI